MYIDQLADRIMDAKEAYYNGAPIMSDAQYDGLEDELRKLDANHPVLKQIGAVAPTSSGWPKVKHGAPMSSLNKAQVAADFDSWWVSCGKPAPIFVTEKLDGISISLRYERGVLVQALTRGDGEVGEDITRNVLLMKGAPHQVKGDDASFYVRGEIVCLKSDHAAHFPGDSNPRNTASGTAKRQSDPAPCKHLTVLSYQYLPDGASLPYKHDEVVALDDMGFILPNFETVDDPIGAGVYYQRYVDQTRAGLDYDIDGLVFEVDDTEAREDLGELHHRPKGAVAYKFPHEEKQTTIRGIRWQVGNSGRVTPVALFDTVALAGANVSKASLHNCSNYADLAGQVGQELFAVGDTILVSRRNDVIPFVEAGIAATQDPSAKVLAVPTECPECSTKLVKDGEYLMCPNTLTCPAQVAGAVKRWVKKIGILDWGTSVIDALCDKGLVSDPADLYTLEDDVLSEVELSGRRVGSSAKRMLDNLHAKKDLPLHAIVGSLGIPLIGRTMAKTIIQSGGLTSLKDLYAATVPQVAAISGVGTTKAKSFVEGFETVIPVICKLLANGVTIAKQATNGKLQGKLICMTGFRDPGMHSAIEAAGGTVKSGVSKKLDYLVAADPTSTSGKAKKARGYGVVIIDQQDMWDMLGVAP